MACSFVFASASTIGSDARSGEPHVQQIGRWLVGPSRPSRSPSDNAPHMSEPNDSTDPVDAAGATTAKHLARNLVSLRHTRGLTQDMLAKHTSVPRSTIANLESGEGNPSLLVLVKVAAALSVPIDELL